jgi:hypothetical protein
MVGDLGQKGTFVSPKPAAQFAAQVCPVEQFAEDVELPLFGGSVSHAHGTAAGMSGEVIQLVLR